MGDEGRRKVGYDLCSEWKMGHEMQGEMGIMLSFACLPQMHSLPLHCLARCRRTDLVNPISHLLLPTLPGRVSQWKAPGGGWRAAGRVKPGCFSRPCCSVQASCPCPTRQPRLCISSSCLAALALAVATPPPSLPLQPWGGCGSCSCSCCDALGCATILSGLSDFPSSHELCYTELPVMACFSERTRSNTDLSSLRCLYETFKWRCLTGSHIYRSKAADSGLGWRQIRS